MKKLFLLLTLSIFACSKTNPSVTTVENYIDAYNQHNIELMLEYLAVDARWMSVNNDRITVETSNNEQLESVLEGYFKDLPSSRSEIQHIAANGRFVSAFEKATWKNKDGTEQAQCAASVYELEEELIKNIWYFSSQNCD